MRAYIDLNYNERGAHVGAYDVADKLEQIAKWLRERSDWNDYSQHGNILAYGDHGDVIGTFALDQMGGKPAPDEPVSRLYRTVDEADQAIEDFKKTLGNADMMEYVVIPEMFKGQERYKVMCGFKTA